MATSPVHRLRGAAVAVLVAALWLATGSPAHAAPSRVAAYATYYGWFDNTPPGCTTAFGTCAGGTGTSADPITFASDPAEFPVGTTLYDPTVQKYFRMGDTCEECGLDWTGHGPNGGPRLHHVDLWLGGEAGSAFAAIGCEDALTLARPDGAPQLTTFVRDPPADLPVSAEPLFDPTTGACFGGAVPSSSTGAYRNAAGGRCLGIAAGPGAPAATTARCPGRPPIRFEASFLIDGDLCLRTTGRRPGSALTWAACDGDAGQQWEVNPNGTITWVQYTLCVTASRARVVLARCAGRAAQRWRFTAAAAAATAAAPG